MPEFPYSDLTKYYDDTKSINDLSPVRASNLAKRLGAHEAWRLPVHPEVYRALLSPEQHMLREIEDRINGRRRKNRDAL